MVEGTPYVLSGDFPQMFWFRLSSGYVEVGSGCSVGSSPLMWFQDPNAIVSFDQGWNSAADQTQTNQYTSDKDSLRLAHYRCFVTPSKLNLM